MLGPRPDGSPSPNSCPAEQHPAVRETLSYLDGYTQREISTLIDVPLGTVKSRMFVGIQRLQTLLGPLMSDLSFADLTGET